MTVTMAMRMSGGMLMAVTVRFMGGFNVRFDKLAETALGFGCSRWPGFMMMVVIVTVAVAVIMRVAVTVTMGMAVPRRRRAITRAGSVPLTRVTRLICHGTVVMVLRMRNPGVEGMYKARPHVWLLRPVIRFTPALALQVKSGGGQLFFQPGRTALGAISQHCGTQFLQCVECVATGSATVGKYRHFFTNQLFKW
jgi:hypothetical protein